MKIFKEIKKIQVDEIKINKGPNKVIEIIVKEVKWK